MMLRFSPWWSRSWREEQGLISERKKGRLQGRTSWPSPKKSWKQESQKRPEGFPGVKTEENWELCKTETVKQNQSRRSLPCPMTNTEWLYTASCFALKPHCLNITIREGNILLLNYEFWKQRRQMKVPFFKLFMKPFLIECWQSPHKRENLNIWFLAKFWISILFIQGPLPCLASSDPSQVRHTLDLVLVLLSG